MKMHSRHASGDGRRRRLPVLFAVACATTALLVTATASAGGRASTPALGWTLQTPYNTTTLYDCAVAGDNSVWAVGNNGTVLYSTNGGASWASQDVPTVTGSGDYFLAVSFDAPAQGWAVSQNGAIICLGGAGPIKQTSPSNVALLDVDAVSANHAWIVGGSGVVLVTADGGTTWTEQTSGTGEPLDGVAFADLTHG